MLKELEQAGLSEKSAKVYLAALELGAATAEQLAKHAKINRSTTYVQIESLSKMGLMTTYEEGKKTYFAPESPEYLHRIIEYKHQEIGTKKKELEEVLPELTTLFERRGERYNIRLFDGKAGLKSLQNEVLETKEKKIYALYNAELLTDTFSKAELDTFLKERDKREVYTKALYTRKAGPFSNVDPRTEQKHISSDDLMLSVDIVTYDDLVAIASPKGKAFGILVQSEEFAQSMKSLFELLWKRY